MHLLIDNSNTRTKFALDQKGVISDWRATIPTKELSTASLADTLAGLELTHLTLCSVVPQTAELIQGHFHLPIHRVSHRSQLPLLLDYPQPETLGADRLANVAAAIIDGAHPAIVIDCGTAVTFDVISAERSFIGGVIAPGTAAMRDYLHQKTAQLPAVQLQEPTTAIGHSTAEAMQIGTVVGSRGLIREIISAISAELGGNPTILATGGDAALIARGLPEISNIDPDLTLKGIQAIGRLNHHF